MHRRPLRETGARRWWWLAVPVLGIAAWAAFSATLSLLGDDGRHAPPPPDAPARRLVMPPAAQAPAPPAAAAPASDAPAPARPATDAAALPVVGSAAPEPARSPDSEPSGAPESAATPGAARAAAANGARRVKPERAPQESLTEQDRRALDALVEQAGKNAR